MNNLPTVYVRYANGKIDDAKVWPIDGGQTLEPTPRLRSCNAGATFAGLKKNPNRSRKSNEPFGNCLPTWLIDGVHGNWSTDHETDYLDALLVATDLPAYQKMGSGNRLSVMIEIAEALAARV